MKRLHKNMLTAGVLLAAGVGFGIYTLKTEVRTPEERFIAAQEKKRLFHFGRVDVVKGTLFAKNATMSFERDGEVWQITSPTTWPADPEAIDAALDRMATIIPEPIITEDADAEEVARAGLDRPVATLAVTKKDGKEHVLHVGRRNKLADRYPITDAAKKKIGLSDSAFFWALDRSLDELRSKRLVHRAEDDVTRITVKNPDGSVRYTLAKNDDGWTTEGAGQEAIPADAGDVLLARVRFVRRLTAESFLTDDYDPNDAAQKHELGLDEPLYFLEIETKDGVDRLTLAEHGTRPDEPMLMHVEGTGTVAVVNPTITEVFERTAAQFRDRTLLRFEKSDTRRIRFVYAGKDDVVVERASAEADWKLGTGAAAKVWKIDSILRGFAYLKANEIYAQAPSKRDMKEWLIEPASRRVVFEGEGGKALGAVRIGKYAKDDLVFVMAAGDDRVGLVEDKKIDLLPKGEEDLLDEGR